MTYLQALVLSIIEGITEFLPISSTAHLVLAEKLLHVPETEFLKSFNIAIQLGAILAVLSVWVKRLLTDRALLKRVIVAFIPTGIIGLLLYKLIKAFLFENTQVILWALLIGGVALIAFELLHKEQKLAEGEKEPDVNQITYKQAVGVGLFQSLAVVPGVSRSASTILGGMLLGLRRKAAVEFSFLVAIPTMAAAVGLDLLKNAKNFSADQAGIMIFGAVIAFVVALLSVKVLTAFVRRHTFLVFGVYRIVLAIVLFRVLG